MSCYRLIDQEKAHHGVSRLARVLGVARAGYYAFTSRPASPRTLADQALTDQIQEIHVRSRGTYGAPRVHAELRLGLDRRVGRKRVARLMRVAGLQGCHRRRGRGLTRRDPQATSAPDLVERDFTPPGPDRLWVADSPSSAPAKAGCMWRSCWTPSPAGSSAGRWLSTCAPNWSWTFSTWRSPSASQRSGWSITATTAASLGSRGRRNTACLDGE